MELTDITQLFKGKATRIKNKEFGTTESYVTPFLERMKDNVDHYIIKVKPADQISLNNDGSVDFENMVYNRVWIQGVLPDTPFNNHNTVISMLYALDTRKPCIKFFKTLINQACLNMTVFSPEAINTQELEDTIDWTGLDSIIHQNTTIVDILTKFSNTSLKRSTLNTCMGNWIENCINKKVTTTSGIVKLNESMPIDVYKDLVIDKESPYYTDSDDISYFDVYNAFTDIITNDGDKDIVNKYDKCCLVGNILGI